MTIMPNGQAEVSSTSEAGQIITLVIDASSDGDRAAYACVVAYGAEKPRLIYGVARHFEHGAVEAWGINQAVRRVNKRFGHTRDVLVMTDCRSLVAARRSGWVRLQ